MLRNKLMPTVVLSAICIIAVALLAAVNLITAPVIENNKAEKVENALLEIMPDGGRFSEVAVEGVDEVNAAYLSENGGYVFQMNVKGYKTGLVIMCGISSDGVITGTKYIQSSETNGAEDILAPMYTGKTAENISSVDVISGSTMTSRGYGEAISAAFEAFEILTGGGINE